MEKNGIEHKPKYFVPWSDPPSHGNPNVKHTQKDPLQYIYNGLYFENDRKKKDWSRLPDLFSEKLPDGVENTESIPPGDEDEQQFVYDAEEHKRITSDN